MVCIVSTPSVRFMVACSHAPTADLVHLSGWAKARFIKAEATGLDTVVSNALDLSVSLAAAAA